MVLFLEEQSVEKAAEMPHNGANITPLMRQYAEVKAKYPEALLLFRVGDFYETFGDDAVKTSAALGIVLTKRNNGGVNVELAGFPFHSLDLYLPRLVRSGYRVAICEQLEKPSPLKKIVKRGVTEIITPGVTTDDKLLDYRSNNYLATLVAGNKDKYGISFLDISTGEFLVSEGNAAYCDKLLQSFNPSEVVLAKNFIKEFEKKYGDRFYTFALEDWAFTTDFTRNKLLQHFEVQSLKGYGIEEMTLAQTAAGVVLHYLATTENTNLKHILQLSRIQSENYIWLDKFTIRNLELVESPHERGISLLQTLDKTVSPMGARMFRKWVLMPLISIPGIEERQNTVSYFIDNQDIAKELEQLIRQVGDLERLISKVPMGKINPREVVQLKRALQIIEPLKNLLKKSDSLHLNKISESLNLCSLLKEKIHREVVEEAPVNLIKGGVFLSGFNEKLDELKHIIHHSKDLLLEIQQKESVRTGVTNLKVGFNSVFGYYLEVTNKYKNQFTIPSDWVRKQTLTTGERYITDELKQLESKIMGAEEKILAIEEKLFQELLHFLSDYIAPIQYNALLIAQIDCLLSFSKMSQKHHYCKPKLSESYVIDIKNGRHPVIEQQLEIGETYVPNDVYLDSEAQQILMITGPNMAGKSALLRQTALICLMAQMGCFVPAECAEIGIIEKIFTRVGASDNLSSGESTFMVEMNETASIMNNINDRSLILLDEIGRGTSTYDGISIAWSITEFLHDNGIAKPKTLFATHYHELNELSEKFPRVKNFHVATKEIDNRVVFLRKLVPGGSEHSFGIQVAKMAGMPKTIVERAYQILIQLEEKHIEEGGNSSQVIKQKLKKQTSQMTQLNIFDADPKMTRLFEHLEGLDLNGMTPIDCMMKLYELKKMID